MSQSTATHTDPTRSRRRFPTKLVVALVLIAVCVVFILQNRQHVSIKLLVPTVGGPLWAALTGVLVLGGIAGYLLVRRRR